MYEISKMRLAPRDPYQALANAIIEQAYNDYVSGDTGPGTDPIYQRKQILQFFRSDRFKLFTDVDPDFLIKRMLRDAVHVEPKADRRKKNTRRY